MSRENHIDRKALKRPDTFVQKGRALMDALFRERRVAMGVIAFVLVSIVGYSFYNSWYDNRLEEDWTAFFQANEAAPEKRVEMLQQAYTKGGNTRAAYLSAVTLGDYFLGAATLKIEKQKIEKTTGKPPKKVDVKDPEPKLDVSQAATQAGEWYQKASGFRGLLPAEREMLLLNRGNALEIQGKWDDALATYKEVVDAGGESKPLALIHSARMHEVKKDKATAKTLYQSVSSEFENTEYARLAKNYLRRMDSRLLEGAPEK